MTQNYSVNWPLCLAHTNDIYRYLLSLGKTLFFCASNIIGINATFSLETAFGSEIYSCLFEKFVLLCGDSLDRIELVAPLFLLRLYWFLLIFAKTLARSKTIMIATLFPSPSFLYLCRFSRDLCRSGRTLSMTCSVLATLHKAILATFYAMLTMYNG